MLIKRLAWTTLLLASYSTLSFAQDDEDDLVGLYDEEELISIATGTEKQIRFAPSVASVITSEDIKNSGARHLSEVLDSVPGVHVGDSILFDDHLISIRGIHTSNNPQVLLLIDGVEITHLFTNARPAGFRLPLNNVARIEIIRGPGSAVYGADAFSGVINVITKSAEDIDGSEFGVRMGSFNTQDAWAQTSYLDESVSAAFSVEYTKSNGDHNRLMTDGLGATGKFRSEYEIFNSQLTLALDNFDIRLYNWQLHNGGTGPGGAQVLDEFGLVNVDYYQFDVGYATELAGNLNFEIRAGYNESNHDIKNVLLPPGTVFPVDDDGNLDAVGTRFATFPDGVIGNPGGDAEVVDTDVAFTFSGLDKHVLRLGFGYKEESVEINEVKNFGPGVMDIVSDPSAFPVAGTPVDVSGTPNVFLDDVSREVYYFSIQDEWGFANDWTLTWGVRYDEFSDVGDTVNPRLALVWAVDYNLTAKLLYGRAFRAPSFTELFSKNNPSQIGNEDLDPETIDTIEAAINYRVSSNLDISANIFYYEIEDLIDFVPSGAVLQAQNAIDQNGEGIELSAEWGISPKLTLDMNLSVQKIEDDKTGKDVADIPGEQLFIGLNWKPADDWNFNIDVNWIGDRERAVGDTRRDVNEAGSYNLVNLAGRKIFDSGLEMNFALKNILDDDGKEPAEFGQIYVENDYPVAGKSAYISVLFHLD